MLALPRVAIRSEQRGAVCAGCLEDIQDELIRGIPVDDVERLSDLSPTGSLRKSKTLLSRTWMKVCQIFPECYIERERELSMRAVALRDQTVQIPTRLHPQKIEVVHVH